MYIYIHNIYVYIYTCIFFLKRNTKDLLKFVEECKKNIIQELNLLLVNLIPIQLLPRYPPFFIGN